MGKHARGEPVSPAQPPAPQDPWPTAPPHVWHVDPHEDLHDDLHDDPAFPPVPVQEPVSPSRPPSPPIFARATAPVGGKPAHPLRRPTAELPVVAGRDQTGAPVRVPGLRRPTRPSLRQLTFGWPLSVTGLFVAFVGWGVWAASVRGQPLTVPIVDFVIVLVVAVGLFAVSRLLGRHLMESVLRRQRRSARLAHAITGLFLCAAGISFLAQTSWVIDGINWLRGFR